VGPCALHYVHNRLNQLVQKKCRFRLDRSTLFIAKSNTQRSAKVNVKRAVQLYTDMRMKTRSADQRRQSLVEVPLCVVGNRLSLLGFLTSLRLFSLDDHFSVLRNFLHARTHAHTHTHTHTLSTLYNTLPNISPSYLQSCFTRVADMTSRRRLRSSTSHRLDVPPVFLSTVDKRAFPVSGATVCNDLPLHVASAPSFAVFRQRLKAFLFSRSYQNTMR